MMNNHDRPMALSGFSMSTAARSDRKHAFFIWGSGIPESGSVRARLRGGAGLALIGALLLGTAPAALAGSAATFETLFEFNGANGKLPRGLFLKDSAGNLYGTTVFGGSASSSGNVFKITPSGDETVLYTFTGSTGDGDGQGPLSGLVADSAGNLYGTTYQGGAYHSGVVFKVAPDGTETVLHSFAGGKKDGYAPYYGNLLLNKKGDLIGTTNGGGKFGNGVVYKLSPDGAIKILHAFSGGTADGCNPDSGVLSDKAGNLYGTTRSCGTTGNGTIFKLARNGTESLLYSFQGGNDGAQPKGGLIQDDLGNFYGVTQYGGADGAGTVFRLAPDGTETVLYAFTGGADGSGPLGHLFRTKNGNLYGTTYGGGYDAGGITCGVVFKLTPDGTETVLHAFQDLDDGCSPIAGLVADPTGGTKRYLYGTASGGRNSSVAGTVFKIKE